MRRRITYVQRPDSPFSFDQAVLSQSHLAIRDLDAVREERATFSSDELPAELWKILQQCHQLHIRWAAERVFDTPAPFASRVSAGLHAFFTPGVEGGGEELCLLLRRVFGEGLDCGRPETSFITPPILSTRFASTAAFQYYSLLPSLDNLVQYIQGTICGGSEECRRHAASIASADSVDINYDSISHALTLSGYWSRAEGKGWTEEIWKHAGGTDQVEVGLLGAEPARELEDIKMGGLLGVVGRDDELKPTMFSFPSRHHSLPNEAGYKVSFAKPTGLHPTMTISMSKSSLQPPPAPPQATCALHSYLTLPSAVFGDKYQLSTTDSVFLDSHNLVSLRAVAGETDLEAPDWAVSQWGSNWLFELATPDQVSEHEAGEWNVTIPLHLRYLRPSESGYRTASVPWPVIFWVCTAEDGTKMGINPFDRVNLGWEGLFGTRTMFYQLHPSPSSDKANDGSSHRLVEDLEVPVLQLTNSGFFSSKSIELGTVAAIVLGFLWVLWKLGLVARSSGTTPAERKRDNNKRGKSE